MDYHLLHLRIGTILLPETPGAAHPQLRHQTIMQILFVLHISQDHHPWATRVMGLLLLIEETLGTLAEPMIAITTLTLQRLQQPGMTRVVNIGHLSRRPILMHEVRLPWCSDPCKTLC